MFPFMATFGEIGNLAASAKAAANHATDFAPCSTMCGYPFVHGRGHGIVYRVGSNSADHSFLPSSTLVSCDE